MLGLVQGILGFIFVFGLVVFVHELGHFLAAKAVNVYAPRFSIGFGPALWSRKWGETEYVLALLPLGGYVRMASRDEDAMAFLEGGGEPLASAEPETVGGSGTRVADEGSVAAAATRSKYYDPDALVPFGPKPVPPNRMFESKSLPARLLIMFAGVSMNVLLGFVVLAFILAYYGQPLIRSRVIGVVSPVAGAPELAKLAEGDTLLAVDGRPVPTFSDALVAIDSGTAPRLTIATQRDTVTIATALPHPTRDDIAAAIAPLVSPVLADVLSGGPAATAGLRSGDSVIAVQGKRVGSWEDMVDLVRAAPGHPLTFEVARDGRQLTVTVRPDSSREPAPDGSMQVVGKIGAGSVVFTDRDPVPLGSAIRTGWSQTWQIAGLIGVTVKQLFTRETSLSSLGGPVAIASASSSAAKQGFEYLLRLLALLSINVAVLNLLPIPILDGGQILINVVEAVRGKGFSLRTREYILRFGLITIAIIFAIVMFNDLRTRIHF